MRKLKPNHSKIIHLKQKLKLRFNHSFVKVISTTIILIFNTTTATPAEYTSKYNHSELKESILVSENENGIKEFIKKELLGQTQKKTIQYKIFGTQYEDVEIKSNQLRNSVFYLVSGHGGPDPGAIAKYNGKTLCEDEYAYDITLRLARILISNGAKVYLITRDPNDGIRDSWYLPPDKDEKCFPNKKIPTSQIDRLKQRVDAVNKLYIQNKGTHQRMVEIHIDSRSKGTRTDVFFYYGKQSVPGKRLAETLKTTMANKYDQHQPGRGYNGTISERDLFMLKYAYPVSSFIELGNIHHERDVKRLIVVRNRQALAQWLAEGLIKDFTNNHK